MDRLTKIQHLNLKSMDDAREHWNLIAKPLHSLGCLEEDIIRIAGIKKTWDVHLDRRAVIVMCGDNGVVEENVTQTGSLVTGIVCQAMAKGDGNINCLGQMYHTDVIPVDIGMASQPDQALKSTGLSLSIEQNHSCAYKIIDFKVAPGTKNMVRTRAMTKDETICAIRRGMDVVGLCKNAGYDIVVTGEMGIGNTTTSAAIAAVLLDVPVEAVTGRGAGLDDAGLQRKIDAIKKAICRCKPDKNDTFKLLGELGGFDIAGLVGIYLGGAVYGIPVVMDGLISAVACALALQICPAARDFILCAHVSKEPAAKMLLDMMEFKPVIHGELCLGEGTGGIMLLPLLDGALAMYHSVHRFDHLHIAQYEELS